MHRPIKRIILVVDLKSALLIGWRFYTLNYRNWFDFTWSHVSCYISVKTPFIHTHVSVLFLLLFHCLSSDPGPSEYQHAVQNRMNSIDNIAKEPDDFCICLIKVVLSFLIFIPHILNNTWILVHWIKNYGLKSLQRCDVAAQDFISPLPNNKDFPSLTTDVMSQRPDAIFYWLKASKCNETEWKKDVWPTNVKQALHNYQSQVKQKSSSVPGRFSSGPVTSAHMTLTSVSGFRQTKTKSVKLEQKFSDRSTHSDKLFQQDVMRIKSQVYRC